MPTTIVIPRLGWNMDEGTFVEWLKADGDAVRRGDVLFRLEGEKAVEEVESLDAGTLHIPADGPKPGDRVAVGTVIGYFLQSGEAPPISEHRQAQTPKMRPTTPVESPLPARPDSQRESEAAISPRARRLAKRLGIDWSGIRGSGRTGRIRERDVLAVEDTAAEKPLIPLTPIRKRIAMRMMQSRQSTAPVTLTTQVDAEALVTFRAGIKQRATLDEAVPSYTDLFIKLAGCALHRHPLLASRWTDAGLVEPNQIDIGFAVDTDAGLLVPVIRDVPNQPVQQIATQSRLLIDRALQGQLVTPDMQGGCFTITNLGMYGIDAFTPIINPSECAVLGIGRIIRRPVVHGDEIVARHQVALSLTFDHRIVDGAPAARFLQTLAQMVEAPEPWVSS